MGPVEDVHSVDQQMVMVLTCMWTYLMHCYQIYKIPTDLDSVGPGMIMLLLVQCNYIIMEIFECGITLQLIVQQSTNIYSGSMLPEVYCHMGLEAVSGDLKKVYKYPKYC